MDLPSAVKVKVVPGGGLSCLPWLVALSADHSPTSGETSFLSLGPGAAKVRVRVRTTGLIGWSLVRQSIIPDAGARVNGLVFPINCGGPFARSCANGPLLLGR